MENLMVVQKGSLDTYQEDLIREQEAGVQVAEAIIKVATERNLQAPKECSNVLSKGEARLKALRAGFLPTDGLSVATIPKRPLRKKRGQYDWSLRRQRQVLTVVDRLPSQVQEAITEAESLEIFDKISITQPGGDPVIVGSAGGWRFLIASWVNLMDGQGIGFRFRVMPVSA